MVSDIVLLKRLPNAVLNSIEAYVSCVSGAMLKDEYLGVIEAAGFQDVTLVDEAAFPLHCMANDPIAQRIIEGLAIPPEEMKEIGNSILSAKVSAAKPKKSV
jgi:arsenite methyltransferase